MWTIRVIFAPASAAKQHNVSAPLLEAGLTKQEIRELARAAAFVSGTSLPPPVSHRALNTGPVTREALSVVEQGEDALRILGFRQFRVRHHGEIVRIEIAREELVRALTPEMAAEFTRVFKPWDSNL
jgi:uncharacterized protein